jgi:adenylate/guanylate cyclase family protein
LATVLFTDLVGSTELASRLGDRRWRELLDTHNAHIRRQLRRFGGREMDTAGDGFFAIFDQPAAAIGCAYAVIDDLRPLGIEVRAGIHMGEVEVIGQKVGGIAVHIGARVASKAAAGEVLVSSTVKDLTAGSDTRFEDRGIQQLKGVDGSWRLFAVQPAAERESAPATPAARAASEQGRRKIGRLLVITGSLVLAAVSIGLVTLLLRHGNVQSPGPSSSSPTTLNAAEQRLMGYVPSEMRSSCRHVTPAFVGADSTLACSSPTGLEDFRDMLDNPDVYHVEYSHFGSSDDLAAAFQQGLHGVPRVPTGDCATDHTARGVYTISGQRAGQVACFRTTQNGPTKEKPNGLKAIASSRSYMEWSDDRVLVYAVAYRNDLGDLPMYQWWVSSAGPVESGSVLLPKDTRPLHASTPDHFPGFATGTYVKTIKNNLDPGRWKQIITGSAMQGQYKTVGPFSEDGYWALGKRDEFDIWTPYGPCANVGFGVYQFHLREPTPGHIFASFHFISDACGYTGPPNGTEWSHGPPYRRVS